MIDLYFDESRNTGEIGHDGKKLNFHRQRYFVLVGVPDKNDILFRYEKFKNNNIRKVKSEKPNLNEIKGSDLMRRDNNHVLTAFVSEFIGVDEYLFTVYDKKYYMISQMIMWLLGENFRTTEYMSYTMFCEILHKVNDIVLIRYIDVTKNNSIDEIKNFLDFLIHYEYSECIGVEFERGFIERWKHALKVIIESKDEYFELLLEENVEHIRLSGRDRNNIVNLVALGETVTLYKLSNLGEKYQIYHDEIEVIQDYMKHYWCKDNLRFVNSKDSLGIQLADNLSSVFGNLINYVLPVINDKSLMKLLSSDSYWNREQLAKFITNHYEHMKIVTTIRERAVVEAYVGTCILDINAFKLEVHQRINDLFEMEMENNRRAPNMNKLVEFLFE